MAPTYSVKQFLYDALTLGGVCLLSYMLAFHATFQFLMWRHRRRNSN